MSESSTWRTLGIIPARGGSKGVPRKNARLLHGQPLIAYTIEAARGAELLTRVILTTDDPEIAEIGRRYGADVPFLRPAELARDDTPMLPVIQHALRFLEDAGDRFDAVCLLQPTNPLRDASLIDRCLTAYRESGADTLVTVLPVPHEYNPHWVYFQTADGSLRLSTGEKIPITRRQELPPAYHREGSVYITRRDVLMERNTIYGDRLIGFPVSPEQSVNIDTLDDWLKAEELLAGSNHKGRNEAQRD